MSRIKATTLTRTQKHRLSALLRVLPKYAAYRKDHKDYVQFTETAGSLEWKRVLVWNDTAQVWLPIAEPKFVEIPK
jgi:hypothetical protein